MTYPRRVVLILFIICLFAGTITGSRVYYSLSYLWALLFVLSWLMSFIALRGIQVNRYARFLRSQVGQIFEERYEIQNPGRLPRLWVEVRDQSALPESRGSQVLTMIGGRESRTYLSRLRLIQRGVFPLGPTQLISGDLFGLFPVNRTFQSRETLLVYPMMVDIDHFPNLPGMLPGGEALRRRTSQITSNASGVREYNTGDPLNRIHWASTARRNRLMVKEFELDPLAEVWIFIDAARTVQTSLSYKPSEFAPQDIWSKRYKFVLPPSTMEYSVTIAASLARYYIQNSRSVGLVVADQLLYVLPADRGGRQLGKMLETLALIRGEGNLPLQSLVEAQARHLPRGSTVIMITPGATDAIYRTSDVLLRRGLRPIVILFNSLSFGGYSQPDRLVNALKAITIPTYCITNGDDVSDVLSTGNITFRLPVENY
jgi:uncharacterized protein (DUF58 family)